MPILPAALYFADLELNAEYQSAARTVTQSDLTTFAGFSGDYNPIHVDHEFAKTTPYRRPVVHGFGVFSIASGLGTQSPCTRTVALLRVSDWTFTAPVFVGDTIHLLSRVHEKTRMLREFRRLPDLRERAGRADADLLGLDPDSLKLTDGEDVQHRGVFAAGRVIDDQQIGGAADLRGAGGQGVARFGEGLRRVRGGHGCPASSGTPSAGRWPVSTSMARKIRS